jgi:hypothetical protein
LISDEVSAEVSSRAKYKRTDRASDDRARAGFNSEGGAGHRADLSAESGAAPPADLTDYLRADWLSRVLIEGPFRRPREIIGSDYDPDDKKYSAHPTDHSRP